MQPPQQPCRVLRVERRVFLQIELAVQRPDPLEIVGVHPLRRHKFVIRLPQQRHVALLVAVHRRGGAAAVEDVNLPGRIQMIAGSRERGDHVCVCELVE